MTLPDLRPRQECRWDIVSLGEVLLRFDPGEQRIVQTRQFEVWEGGGEYNVARGLSSCFQERAAHVTALVDNPVGRLVESRMRQSGVDVSHVLWRPFDGVGAAARNGLYFLERGFGVRGALGCMDRGHTAVAELQPGDVDWERLFGEDGVRWFHTGGIFCALSASTARVAREAMEAARRHGAIVSFDCNYRPSLWKALGGRQAAARANRELCPLVDVLFGHEGDLALELTEASQGPPVHTPASYEAMARRVIEAFPRLRVLATPMRRAASANRNDWGGFAFAQGQMHQADAMRGLEILDRVGGGDAFASGFVYGLLEDRGVAAALGLAVAHGALAMTTPGDGSYATLAEVERLMANAGADVQR